MFLMTLKRQHTARLRFVGVVFFVCCLFLSATTWAAGPEESRAGNHAAKELLPDWLKLDAEYRLRSVYINPLDLSGEVVRETSWAEQRLRVDVGFKVPRTGAIYIQLDMLDGVLMGDNGDFPGDPQSNSGVGIATQRPNNVGYDTLVIPGEDLSLIHI